MINNSLNVKQFLFIERTAHMIYPFIKTKIEHKREREREVEIKNYYFIIIIFMSNNYSFTILKLEYVSHRAPFH